MERDKGQDIKGIRNIVKSHPTAAYNKWATPFQSERETGKPKKHTRRRSKGVGTTLFSRTGYRDDGSTHIHVLLLLLLQEKALATYETEKETSSCTKH